MQETTLESPGLSALMRGAIAGAGAGARQGCGVTAAAGCMATREDIVG